MLVGTLGLEPRSVDLLRYRLPTTGDCRVYQFRHVPNEYPSSFYFFGNAGFTSAFGFASEGFGAGISEPAWSSMYPGCCALTS